MSLTENNQLKTNPKMHTHAQVQAAIRTATVSTAAIATIPT